MNLVKLNGFGVEILSDAATKSFVRNGNQYVSLAHQSEYRIRLTNDTGSRSDATVWIDGTKVGTWRVNSYSTTVIERPVSEHRKFTFIREYSAESHEGGLNNGSSNNGLIRVQFRPEEQTAAAAVRCRCKSHSYSLGFESAPGHMSLSMPMSMSMNNGHNVGANFNADADFVAGSTNGFMSGGTVLGSHSNQQFGSKTAITRVDHSKITDIYLRLVAPVDHPRYKPLSSVNVPRSTPVPPRITPPYDPITDPFTPWNPTLPHQPTGPMMGGWFDPLPGSRMFYNDKKYN